MNGTLRFVLLVCGALAGVGLAVYLAAITQPTQQGEEVAALEEQQPPRDPIAPAFDSPAKRDERPSTAPQESPTPSSGPQADLQLVPPVDPPAQGSDSPTAALPLDVTRLVDPHPPITQLPLPGVEDNEGTISTLMKMLDQVKELQPALQGAPLVPPPSEPLPTPNSDPAPNRYVAPPREPTSSITAAPNRDEGDDSLMIDIQDEDLRKVLEMLSKQGGLNILASNSVQGRVSAVLNNVSVDSALNAILRSTGFISRREGDFIYVGTPADFSDSDRSLDRISTRIYRPNYVTAAELQSLITPLLSEQVGKSSVTSAAQTGIAANASEAGGDSLAGGDALLVQDYEAVLAQIDQVFAEVDRKPLQVSIEAMILSVRLSDEYSFGINWQFLRNRDHVRFGLGSPPTGSSDSSDESGDTSLTPFSFNGGLTFAFLDSNLGAFLNALETVGDTNVIASPHLMCLNKQRAEILIGAQLGYIQQTVTETSTTQGVEFLEIGTQLRLRPFISSDGMIRLEVHPELSTGSVPVRDGFTLPEKETTQVTTNIMCRDGATVIIGGLLREDVQVTTSQVPLLGNLPYVGPLFRQKTEELARSEILVLITPRIVCDPVTYREGDEMAMEFHRRHAVVADHLSPIGKRHLSRKYFRRAQDAWAVGDQDAALHFCRWAVQFDPNNRAAIDLKTDILAGRHDGPYSGGPLSGPDHDPLDALDGDELPDWLLRDLEELEEVPPGHAQPSARRNRHDLTAARPGGG